MANRNRTIPDDQLPALGDIAENGTGLTVWCDDDCACRGENGHRYQVIYRTEDLAVFAETYGHGVIFIEWKDRLRCSVCGSAKTKFVLSGHKTPP